MWPRHSLDVVNALASSKEGRMSHTADTAELSKLTWLQSTGLLPSHFNQYRACQSCGPVSLPACCTCSRYSIPLMNVHVGVREVKLRHSSEEGCEQGRLAGCGAGGARAPVSDTRIICLVQKWFKAGVLNDGELSHP
jgi:hypothetical protein